MRQVLSSGPRDPVTGTGCTYFGSTAKANISHHMLSGMHRFPGQPYPANAIVQLGSSR